MKKIKPKFGVAEWLILVPLMLVHIVVTLMIFTDSWLGGIIFLLFPYAMSYYHPRVIEINEENLVYFGTFKGLKKISYSDIIKVDKATLYGVIIVIKQKNKKAIRVTFTPGTEYNLNQALKYLRERNNNIIIESPLPQ